VAQGLTARGRSTSIGAILALLCCLAAGLLASQAGSAEGAQAKKRPPFHAWCYTQFPMETSFDNFVQSRQCVVKDLKGEDRGKVYGHWLLFPPEGYDEFQVAARLYAKLTYNGKKVDRTREVVNPLAPYDVRTKAFKRPPGLWCLKVRERTPIGNRRAAKTKCRRI
jgi:hypothetical protein